ncbi:DUF86 domain-containing protein [Haloarcula salina]|uniref:DUF86 domain-containing protein n=1 Tax=Haloarcula salina TaxID=1429914 RepID=A0AA41G2F1_9EURY|nr:DUF86 domain-containing protein [Haloarcula salina]
MSAHRGPRKRRSKRSKKNDIITTETQAKISEAVGFRNVLAHRYGDVDHDVVYEVLHTDLHWFERFQREIAQWVQNRHV